MSTEQIKNTIILSIIAVSIFAIYQTNNKKTAIQAAEIALVEQKQAELVNHFKDIQVEAKSALVLDVSKNTVLYDKFSEEQLPLASITKVMTAIITKEVYSPENMYLPEEKLNNLMTAMLIASNNDAASVLAKSSETRGSLNFVGLMNKKAGELGLKQTIFSNPTGLDISESVAGAYGSAEDVANLIIYGYQKYPEVFSQTKYPEAQVGGETILNKNILTSTTPNIVAGKTGLTNLAGGNLALLVEENNKLFAVVVLGSSEKGRFDDAEKLISAVAQYAQQ